MSENKESIPLGISMINFRKEEQVQQSFVKHPDDFWFSTNLEKNKKLLFFSGLSHFTTVINASLSDLYIVLYFQKSQQAQTNCDLPLAPSPEYEQLVSLVNDINKARQTAFNLLITEPERILPEVLMLRMRREMLLSQTVKSLGATNYILYVVGFNSICQCIEIDQMVLSSGLLRLMGKDPKTEIVKTLSNKKVDEIWTEHDYLVFTKSMLYFYIKAMEQIAERRSCINIDNFVIFDGIRHLRAQGQVRVVLMQIIKCRACYTYRHPMIISSEITEIGRERVVADPLERQSVEIESSADQENLKNKLLKYDKSNKIRTASITTLNSQHCKPIKIVSNFKNT